MSERCTKKKYATAAIAADALRRLRKLGGRPEWYITVCQDDNCDAYHLSSGRGKGNTNRLKGSLFALKVMTNNNRLR
jgi:hypothetical protein